MGKDWAIEKTLGQVAWLERLIEADNAIAEDPIDTDTLKGVKLA